MARPKSGNEARRASTTVDRQMYARFEAIARAHKVTPAWLIRWAIEEIVEKEAKGIQPELPLRR
jgi:predicted transcriptional regulator